MSDAPTPNRRPIWIISARVGAGHVQAAKAVEEACANLGFGDLVHSVDLMTLVPRWFKKLYAGGYARMASNHPKLFGTIYHATDRSAAPFPTITERIRVSLDSRIIRPLIAMLEDHPPKVVLHTHFLAPAPIGNWLARQGIPCRHGIVVTDFHPHRIWLASRVDRYFVGVDSARDRLATLGVDPKRVEVTGIPILARHKQSTEKSAVFRDFNWPADRPVILLLAGSDFVVGPFERIVDDLLTTFPNVTLQVATGRNETLHKSLETRLPRFPQFRLIGFTGRMNELFAAATIVVTKTGGITTSECVAAGAAVIGLFPVPGQEELNADYLASAGAGLKVTRRADVIPAVRSLLNDPARLASIQSSARKLGRADAAERVANWIRESCGDCGQTPH